MIGNKLEEPSVINYLLEKTDDKTGKPDYHLAPEYPLLLFDCLYDNVQFKYDCFTTVKIYEHINDIILKNMIEMTLYKSI